MVSAVTTPLIFSYIAYTRTSYILYPSPGVFYSLTHIIKRTNNMQIDFHHTVTYVVSRLAGLTHTEAEVVAYSAQYVDDATNSGSIYFDNDAMYYRLSSAHKLLDYRNFDELSNHHVWIPFHFLPGNDGLPAGSNPDGSFIRKLVCKPNSYVARDMIDICTEDKDKPYGLHRLGIGLHTLVDTWAHRGFCGVNHKVNRVKDLDIKREDDGSYKSRLKEYFEDLYDDTSSQLVSAVLPLGHGGALSYPDLPYLKWEYTNGLGERIVRDNPSDYMEAVQAMYRAVLAYKTCTPYSEVEGTIPEGDYKVILDMFISLTSTDGEGRHSRWLEEIAKGSFSFGPSNLEYIAKGIGSWKYIALGTTKEIDLPYEEFPYTEGFLVSDWKYFHDALQKHRLGIVQDILPKYGICVA